MNHRFPPEARLRARHEYRRVYDTGRRVSGRFFVCFLKSRDGGELPARLGVTVPRRVGPAVIRNRIRRVVKEYFRRRRDRVFPAVDIVVNARPSAARQPTEALWRDLRRTLERAGALGAESDREA